MTHFPPPSRRHAPPSKSRRRGGRYAGKRSRRRPTWFTWLREVVIVLVLALLISTLLRQFAIQVFSIPSESMMNTLQVGDRILVSRIPGSASSVDRGDVVVFEDSLGWMAPTAQEEGSVLRPVGEFLGLIPADGNQIIVKRIIGMEGDTVECCTAEGHLLVNGVPIVETYLPMGVAPAAEEFSVLVPEGNYWVMGDNRSNSADSLYHYLRGDDPFVKSRDVIGPAKSVIWPLSRWSTVGHRDVFKDVPHG